MPKRLLQALIALFCLVPISAGLQGILGGGAAFQDVSATVPLDSHIRYLSGLLLGLGLAFLSCVPNLEKHARRFLILTALVFIGGLARLYGVIVDGNPGPYMVFGLFMELVVTPLLCVGVQFLGKEKKSHE